MENLATSKICSYDEEDQWQAMSFHNDGNWSTSSSMDDLLMFDVHSSTTHSSSYQYFETRLCGSSAMDGGAQPSASSFRSKRRKMAADDDLEDTATSPPHPSIVSKMDELSSKQKKTIKQRAMMNQTKHKAKGSEEYGEVEDKIIEVGFLGRDNNNYCSTGLKNIGLCLVPVSMALNYFG